MPNAFGVAAAAGAAPKRLVGALPGVAAGADAAPHWNAGWDAAGTMAPNAGAEDGAPNALDDAALKLKALAEEAAGALPKPKALVGAAV